MCCLDLICFWWFSCGGETIATSDVKCQMAVNFFTSLQRCLFFKHMMIRLALRVTFKKSKGNLEVSKWLPSYKQKGTILGSRLHDPDNFSQQQKKILRESSFFIQEILGSCLLFQMNNWCWDILHCKALQGSEQTE